MKPKGTLKVVALAASKGGVGKTTLASALAVRAAEDGNRVALIDVDPQASLFRWWELRGEPDNPKIFEMDASAEALGLLMLQGWDWVFVDTPPALFDLIGSAIYISDFVLIPTRASVIDVDAVSDVVDICNEQEKAFAFVINAVHPDWPKLSSGASNQLKKLGPVLPAKVELRECYVSAMTKGKSGPEVDRTREKEARKEIDALWASVKKAVSKQRVMA
jgi:chromosome partitioning protein